MERLFGYCHNLTSLDISNWVVNANNIWQTFNECDKLFTLNMCNCSSTTINKFIGQLPEKTDKYGKLYILNNKEHDLIYKATLDAKNWKAVIYGGNIKAVHIPEGIFNSLGLGNVLLKHIHIGERFLED
jgi:hypothetical protein